MKINYTLAALFCAATLTTGCSSDTDDILENTDVNIERPAPELLIFAPADDAKELNGTSAQKLSVLLKKVGPDVAKGYGEINIKAEEAEEIKVFTDELVKDCKNNREKFETIFKWLVDNIHYATEYEGGDFISNDPYPVFTTKTAICQGFSNLQHIMMESQDIPTINVNGQLVGGGGHAWNYVFIDRMWWVSDATNGWKHMMHQTDKYKQLQPSSADVVFFETEDATFNFYNNQLNVDSVKTKDSQFIVPYSAGGYKVTSLCPTKKVPANVKEIYISKNIKDLGASYYRGLEQNAPSIEAAYMSPENIYFKSYTGVVYQKRNNTMIYLPSGLKKMEMLGSPTLDKNVVFDHKALEEVIIPNGVKEISDYAFEKCPNLRVAYIPEGVNIAERAFWDVHPDFKIVREDLTGIPEIRI